MIHVRRYASDGPSVVVLHGGPGAPGYMAPVAEALAAPADATAPRFLVLEPLQRPSGGAPLTVAQHVDDLDDVVHALGGARPALVGSSWGAMLALAWAAAHPDDAGPLVLIGSGTWEPMARARMRQILDERRARGLDRFNFAAVDDDEPEVSDERANRETWDDMVRLQEAGVFPAALAAIRVPVLMLHGAYDPHPGALIRDSLRGVLPQLEYREWERCGHYPWRERFVRDEFLATLRGWLHERLR